MPEYRARVTLTAKGVDPTEAEGVVQVYSPVQRIGRAAALFGIAVLAAASLIPIPLIHLLGPPILLVLGIVFAVRQLRAEERLKPLKLPCPKCGYKNRLGGGIGVRSLAEPMVRQCESCRRELTLQVERRKE